MTTSYTPSQPGTWLLFVTGDTVLFTEAAEATAVDELWAAVGSEAPVQATLDVLTRAGLSSAPSFALGQVVAGRLHALVRGPIVLDAVAAAGTEAIDGTGVSTWRETTVDGVTALSLGEHTGALPVGRGVVWAAGFAFQPGDAPIAAPAATPTPVIAAPTPVVKPIPEATPAPVVTSVETPAPVFIEPPVAVVPATPVAPPAEVTDPDLPSEHTMVEREDELEPDPVTPSVVEPVQTPGPVVDTSYSHLFEETVHRSIEEAAIREAEPEEEAAVSPKTAAPSLGDHDGETVMSGDIAELRNRRKPAAAASVAPVERAIYLELPNNQRESLSQPVIIGRSPSVSQVSGTELPRLVSIPGSQDISRNHARFAVEGGTVVVTDLHSRNGTSVALPGKPAQMLRKGEPTAVLPGTIVDLGGGVSLTVREG